MSLKNIGISMSIHICRVRIKGCTSLLLAGVFVLSDELFKNASFPAEESIVRTILKGLLSDGLLKSSNIDHVYTVASLPRAHPEFLTQNALSFVGLNVGHSIELGNNCATILDALALSASFTEADSKTVVICADAFKSTYKANLNDSSWLDGGAALVFGNGDLKLTIESYVTANDHDFSRMCSFTLIDGSPQLILNSSPNFLEKDLQTEIEVSKEAISLACLHWKDIHGYVKWTPKSGQ
jgi:3-oxoacyl-[acyl-carrier-protein] synthase III